MAVADHVAANRKAYRRVETLGLLGASIILAMVFAWGLYRVASGDLTQCARLTADSQSTGLLLAAVTGIGFVVGRPVAYFRKVIHQAPSIVDGPVVIRTGGALQGGLALFLAATAILLAYETYAVLMNGNPPPITSYVRCAAADHAFLPPQVARWPASITAFLVGTLIGNWLWYPSDNWLWRRKTT